MNIESEIFLSINFQVTRNFLFPHHPFESITLYCLHCYPTTEQQCQKIMLYLLVYYIQFHILKQIFRLFIFFVCSFFHNQKNVKKSIKEKFSRFSCSFSLVIEGLKKENNEILKICLKANTNEVKSSENCVQNVITSTLFV